MASAERKQLQSTKHEGMSCKGQVPDTISVFTWLKLWEKLLGEVSKGVKGIKGIHFDGMQLSKWVSVYPESEMGILLKCLEQYKKVVRHGQQLIIKHEKATDYYNSPKDCDLYQYATDWKMQHHVVESLLFKLSRGESLTESPQQGQTHVTRITLKEPQASNKMSTQGWSGNIASHVDVREWVQRWNLVMEAVDRERKGNTTGRFYFSGLDFWTWIKEWPEEPMDFLYTCLLKLENFMYNNKDLPTSATSHKRDDQLWKLQKDADNWKAEESRNRSILNMFEDNIHSWPEVANNMAWEDGDHRKPREDMVPQFERSKTWQPESGKSNRTQQRELTMSRMTTADATEENTGEKKYTKGSGAKSGVYTSTRKDVQARPQTAMGLQSERDIDLTCAQCKSLVQDQAQRIIYLQAEVERLSSKDSTKKGSISTSSNVQMRKKEKDSRLLRTKSSYGNRQVSEYTKEDLIRDCLQDIEEKDAEIAMLNEDRNRLKAEVEKLSSSLSKMMHQEISRDESSLENISVKARPMKISEEYQLIQTSQWLEAKQAVDDYTDDTWNEEQKNEVLMAIMMESYKSAEVMFKDQRAALGELLNNPVEKILRKTSSNERKEPMFTKQLDLALANYLKLQSQAVNFKDFGRDLLQQLLQKYKLGTGNHLSKRMRDFCSTMCSLSWKMVVQTPPMTFDASEMGKPFVGSKHEPHWGSQDAGDPGVIILYYICPAMYHGSQVMTRAKVLLGVPKSSHSTRM